MNDPFTPPKMRLTDLDLVAWHLYEDKATKARNEYNARPIAKPCIPGHHYCLCCDILTEQDSTVCLSCQARSTEWRDFAADPEAIAAVRRANRYTPALLRKVDA